MEKFDRLTGVAAPLLLENINTDAIIPVPWIVNFGRDLGQGLFGGWRYDAAEREKPDFVLNQPPGRVAAVAEAPAGGVARTATCWGARTAALARPAVGSLFPRPRERARPGTASAPGRILAAGRGYLG